MATRNLQIRSNRDSSAKPRRKRTWPVSIRKSIERIVDDYVEERKPTLDIEHLSPQAVRTNGTTGGILMACLILVVLSRRNGGNS